MVYPHWLSLGPRQGHGRPGTRHSQCDYTITICLRVTLLASVRYYHRFTSSALCKWWRWTHLLSVILMTIKRTHSSRMRTVRCSGRLGGKGVCLGGGGCQPVGCLCTPPLLPVDRQTPVKHYLSAITDGDGNDGGNNGHRLKNVTCKQTLRHLSPVRECALSD